ncbi:MAG: glycoside hydrolase family 127 protein [bacterium]
MSKITLNDPFWNGFRDTVVRVGIPYQWQALNDELPPDTEPSHCLENFRIAAGTAAGEHRGYVFQDSDVYKWLEGVAFSLRWHPDAALEALADEAIRIVAAAQQPDGYLDTYYIINGLDRRWTNLRDNHELYCAGHLIEAAVAYAQATGKRELLNVALRLVRHIDGVLGPEAGKLHGYPGHPVIEMALMRLYDLTKDPDHLRLARYFVDQRGQSPKYFEAESARYGHAPVWKDGPLGYSYYQAHMPVRLQKDAVGHAVRAMYLYSGMADVARATGDAELAAACRNLWRSATRRRMYITGGIGSSEHGEAFTFDYDLPNDTCYTETCAAIGLVFFARRMLRLEPLGEYADVMERALYNGVISGMQLDGQKFFYVNPLEVVPEACAKDYHKRHVKPERQKWFGCACCPPNIIRLLMSLEDYISDDMGDALFIHLYASGEIQSTGLTLRVDTRYPWEGSVRLSVEASDGAARSLALRVPGWCKTWTLCVNGSPVEAMPANGYVYIARNWREGDQIDLEMEMPVRVVRAHSSVREDIGSIALQRGPMVYCLEEADNGPALHAVRVAQPLDEQTNWEPDQLGGVVMLDTAGIRELTQADDAPLYTDAEPETEAVRLRWIPYYAWANRGVGEMRVWVRR